MKSKKFVVPLACIPVIIAAAYYNNVVGRLGVWKSASPANSTLLKYPPRRRENIVNKTRNPQAKCIPSRNLVFIKTHKTASSTLLAIVGKYASRMKIKNQVINFPPSYIGGYPGHFRSNLTFYRDDKKTLLGYNPHQRPSEMLLAGHFRFHKDEILSFMPPKPKFITIMRNPFKQFDSAYNFYYGRWSRYTGVAQKVPCFGGPVYHVMGRHRANLAEYLEKAKYALDNGSLPWFFRSRNYQSFDLGLDPLNTDEEYLRKSIADLDSVMDLVLIKEYFEESLVLLKNILCMEWEDLIVPPQEVNPFKKHVFTEKEKDVVRYLNNQDFLLYDHFNKTFWNKVEKFGRENMERELKSMRAVKQQREQRPGTRILLRKQRSKDTATNNNHFSYSNREVLFQQLQERMNYECTALKTGCPGPNATLEVAKHIANNHGLCSYYSGVR